MRPGSSGGWSGRCEIRPAVDPGPSPEGSRRRRARCPCGASCGNRTLAKETTGSAVKNLTTTFDAAGLPTSATDAATGETVTYTHDAIGNLTGIDSSIAANDWTFAYDPYSRTTCTIQGSSCASGSSRVLFTLDALDRALSRVKASSTTLFTYRGVGEDIAKTVIGSATTTYAPTASGAPLAEKTGSVASFYLSDPHGDVVGLASTSAANQGTMSFDPWGSRLASSGQTSFLGYQGDMTDPDTKQVDMGTRWYVSGLGRFSSRDVVLGSPSSPTTMNQHVYGGMNPITMWDPTGMGECTGAGECVTKTPSGGLQAVGGNPGAANHPMHNSGSQVQSGTAYDTGGAVDVTPRPPRPDPMVRDADFTSSAVGLGPGLPDGTKICEHGGGYRENTCSSFDFDSYGGPYYRSCSRFNGCREVAGEEPSLGEDLRGVAHWGYGVALTAARCVKYAWSCAEDIARVSVPTGGFVTISLLGGALAGAGCAGTVGLGCGLALAGGGSLVTAGIILTVAYWDAMMSGEHKPFDYSDCDPMPAGTWRPTCEDWT
jgi:RHS repeat-associated protein